MNQVRDYITANLGGDIAVSELAGLINLSRFHFIRAFKKVTAMAPYQFVLSRRIERAKELLVEPDFSIAAVARSVGFHSTLQLDRGEVLSQKGYVVLLIDSFQPRGHVSLCAILPVFSRPILPNRETPMDAFGAMNYLRSRSDVRPDSIAILGQSYGGMALMFTIANGALPKDVPPEKDFRAVIAIYPNCPPVADKDPHWRPRQPMLLFDRRVRHRYPSGAVQGHGRASKRRRRSSD